MEYKSSTLPNVLKLLAPDVMLYEDEMHLKGSVRDFILETKLPIQQRLLGSPNLLK